MCNCNFGYYFSQFSFSMALLFSEVNWSDPSYHGFTYWTFSIKITRFQNIIFPCWGKEEVIKYMVSHWCMRIQRMNCGSYKYSVVNVLQPETALTLKSGNSIISLSKTWPELLQVLQFCRRNFVSIVMISRLSE